MCTNGDLWFTHHVGRKNIKNTIKVAQQWSRWANFVVLWVRHFFGMIKINFLLPIFGEEYSEGSQEWTFSIKKEIYCKNFSLLILPTKAFRRFLPKLCAFSPRHQWLGILVIPTHIKPRKCNQSNKSCHKYIYLDRECFLPSIFSIYLRGK